MELQTQPKTPVKITGRMALQSLKRPADYTKLPQRQQWAIDANLGILDWDGSLDK